LTFLLKLIKRNKQGEEKVIERKEVEEKFSKGTKTVI
jgi:hypothetical protein